MLNEIKRGTHGSFSVSIDSNEVLHSEGFQEILRQNRELHAKKFELNKG